MVKAWQGVLGTALTLLTVGCGGGGPAAPTGGVSAAPTAVVRGTVQWAGAGATSLPGASVRMAGAGAGLSVSVVGTSLQTRADDAGRFVVGGIPEGAITLRFTGGGLDATLPIGSLRAGDDVSVEVQIEGGQAVLVSGGGQGAPVARPSDDPSPEPGEHASPEPEPSPDDHGGQGQGGDDSGGDGSGGSGSGGGGDDGSNHG